MTGVQASTATCRISGRCLGGVGRFSQTRKERTKGPFPVSEGRVRPRVHATPGRHGWSRREGASRGGWVSPRYSPDSTTGSENSSTPSTSTTPAKPSQAPPNPTQRTKPDAKRSVNASPSSAVNSRATAASSAAKPTRLRGDDGAFCCFADTHRGFWLWSEGTGRCYLAGTVGRGRYLAGTSVGSVVIRTREVA